MTRNMRAKCPNDPTHRRFVTTAHVVEEWLVDSAGLWVETRCTLETAHGPDPGNIWQCAECGATAVVESAPLWLEHNTVE